MSALCPERMLSATVVLHEASSHEELIPELPARLKTILGASRVSMVLVGVAGDGSEITRVNYMAGLGIWQGEGPVSGDWVKRLLDERKARVSQGLHEALVHVAQDGRTQAVYELDAEHVLVFDIQTAAAVFTITEQGKLWMTALLGQVARNLRTQLNRATSPVRDAKPFSELTKGEWRVLLAIDGEEQEKQIAGKMALSTHTIHSHIKHVYRIMNVRSRIEAIAKLHRAERLALLREMMPREIGQELDGGTPEAAAMAAWGQGRVAGREAAEAIRPFERLVGNKLMNMKRPAMK